MIMDLEAMGERIRTARKALGWTQLDLADLLQVSDTYISHLEIGRHRPGALMVVDLAQTLSLDVDSLCRGYGHLPPDIEAWLLAKPGRLEQVRRAMERKVA